MSFSFSGAGPKADVVHQIRSHHGYVDQLAIATRDFITAVLENDQTENQGNQGFVYWVQANGHSGPGGATSLNITIEPMWVPAIRRIDQVDLELPDRAVLDETHSAI